LEIILSEPTGRNVVKMLVYAYVWNVLPLWIRGIVSVIFLIAFCAGFLLFYRMGVISMYGEVFTSMGHSIWDLIKDLGVLFVYAFTGHCMVPKCV
jgi:hypothetical protein